MMLRLTEKMLPEDANLLDALIQASPAAIAVADLNHKTTLTDPAFSRIFGYEPEECVGRMVNDLIVPPEAQAGFQNNGRLVLGGSTVLGMLRRKRKDGTLVDVECYAVPVSSNGESQGGCRGISRCHAAGKGGGSTATERRNFPDAKRDRPGGNLPDR